MIQGKKVVAVIPARYASTRYPGKPLVDLGGKPMIQRTYEQVAKVKGWDQIIIATDDERIYQVAQSFGAAVMMTPLSSMAVAKGAATADVTAELTYPKTKTVNVVDEQFGVTVLHACDNDTRHE